EVEAVSEIEILRPSDTAKANRRLLYEVLNRRRKLSLTLFNDAPGGSVLITAEQAGNGSAPLATYVAWNRRGESFAPGDLCDLWGTTFPFAGSKEERLAKGDPRVSLEERYPKPATTPPPSAR